MKILDNMDLCYGCGACENICPKDAITMAPAWDGFLYPRIDSTKCIECKACQRVCPQLHSEYPNNGTPQVYAAMAADEIRAKSASGGVFTVLAEHFIREGGCVCGCVFQEDFRGTKHVMVERLEELEQLRNSKYIQSASGNIYRQVRDKLEQQRPVLFVGTPCQCAALHGFLGKSYEKLLVVDLICHGTASPAAWNHYLQEVADGRGIAHVNFRYKGITGWSSTTYIAFQDGKEYIKSFKDDCFEQAFSGNLITRKSCGTCQFARIPRQGDLTIGDFWGISGYKKELDDRKGTSAILVNTRKGEQLLESLQGDGAFPVLEEVPFYDGFARRNGNVYRFSNSHPGRKVFFQELENGKKFSEALSASKDEKYDIALFSIWYAANYGSLMTNFALYQTLTDMGYNCIFADIPDHLWSTSKTHRDPLFVTRRFGYKHFQLTAKYKNRADLKKLNNVADTFLVGSDQIWNYSLCKSAGTYFYLDFADSTKKKIAYGTSFGHRNFNGNAEERKTAGYFLRSFDAVSVREDYAVDLCRDAFGVEAVQVLDPVFMCKKDHYLRCIGQSKLSCQPKPSKYLLAYILDPTEEKQQALEYVAAKKNLELICIPNALVRADMRANWRLPIQENLDMEDWLYYFSNAEMVITDSFHGSCFSIIFEKPFIAIGNRRRGLDRFYSLMGELDLQNYLVMSAGEIMEKEYLYTSTFDYEAINRRLAELRTHSMQWLKSALEAEHSARAYSSYDVADRRMDQIVRDLEAKIAKLTKQVEEQGKALERQREEARQQLEEAVNDISGSYSYRIGRAATFVPRKIREIIKGE